MVLVLPFENGLKHFIVILQVQLLTMDIYHQDLNWRGVFVEGIRYLLIYLFWYWNCLVQPLRMIQTFWGKNK